MSCEGYEDGSRYAEERRQPGVMKMAVMKMSLSEEIRKVTDCMSQTIYYLSRSVYSM